MKHFHLKSNWKSLKSKRGDLNSNGYGGGGGGGRDFRQGQQQYSGYHKQPAVRNTDPGVWDPEDEEDPGVDASFTRYADEGEFFQELTESRAQLAQQEQEEQQQQEQGLLQA